MISMVIAGLMSVAVMQLFIAETNHIRQESHRDITAVETQTLFETLSRLLRMAQVDSINIQSATPPDADQLRQDNDSLDIRFTLPENYRVWPNDQADSNGLYSNNQIRLYWQNNGQTELKNDTLYIAWSTPENIEQANLLALNNASTPIINLDIWPTKADQTPADNANITEAGGLLINMISRSPGQDLTFNNSLDTTGEFKHIRTHQSSTIVAPRN